MTSRAQVRREHEAGLTAYRRFRATQAEGDKPRTYVSVNADTGEVTTDPSRCTDPQAAEELAARLRGKQ